MNLLQKLTFIAFCNFLITSCGNHSITGTPNNPTNSEAVPRETAPKESDSDVSNFVQLDSENFNAPEPVVSEPEKPARRNNQYTHKKWPEIPEGFARHAHKFKRTYKKTTFLYEVDYMQPKDSAEYSDELARWIVNHLNSRFTNKPKAYEGNLYDADAVMRFLANQYFLSEQEDYYECEGESYEKVTLQVEYLTDKFVTFYDFSDCYSCSAAHDLYGEYLMTYDLVNQQVLTNAEIFRHDALNSVKELLFQTAFEDEYYMGYNDAYSSIKSVRKVFTDGKTVEEWQMPDAALVKGGVVFCFQPYQIAYFAAGTFHFFISYAKVKNYLTDYCKELFE